MKAGKALGTVLLIFGALALLTGLSAIVLPMMPFEPVKEALSGLQAYSDISAGKMLQWLLENGCLTLGIGAGLIVLGTVLRGFCARAVRNRARREAEERRNSLMEQKQHTFRNEAARPVVQDRYAAAAGIPPVAAPRQDTYVSPVPIASPRPLQQRQTNKPLVGQIDSVRRSLYEQKRIQQPQHHEPSAVIHTTSFESEELSPALKRTGKNPYVRPLFPQSEWEIVEKGFEKSRNPYARQQNLTTTVPNEWEVLEKTLTNRTTDYYATHQTVSYADHVASQQSSQPQIAESLMQRMSAALPEIVQQEIPLAVESQDNMELHNPEWNQPTDLTTMDAWNTSEMSAQPVWEARGVLSSENASEATSESRSEIFVEEPGAQKKKEALLIQEKASETVPAEEMPVSRSRMGRRAVQERESIFVDKDESKELLAPASSRIKLTVGKHTSEK